MSNTRHVVIIRKDLQFVPGLLAAQAAHISDMFIRQRLVGKVSHWKFSKKELEWMQEPYITILSVSCQEELNLIANEAIDAGLPVQKWFDTVITPTLGKKVNLFVGISIGPEDSDKLAVVTSTLPLY
jgi:peptidyl-tRNA hydrolase